jgi:1-deoxy-D-xylulose-5-phosphate reductoisomerase
MLYSMKRKLIILGSTGSIGVNSLHCVSQNPEQFEVVALSTNRQVEALLEQCRVFRPGFAAVTGVALNGGDRLQFRKLGVTLFEGPQALVELIKNVQADLVVNAVVGAAGFLPTLEAIENGSDIALANKETLVIGGEHVMRAVKKKGVALLPIDSEHSAVFQSLMGEDFAAIEEILLTASGGPFRNLSKSEFRYITVEQALRHPNWSMGKKITIDSATMMNKGLEVIEACRLFAVPVERIRVVIHPQSIIHSMVAFYDGSIKAQLGAPDMRVPIQLALTWPRRMPSTFPRLDMTTLKELTFDVPDLEKFRCLALAYEAMRQDGTVTAVLNAANEIAVARFLANDLRFDQIEAVIEATLSVHSPISHPAVEELLHADEWARRFAESVVVH